MGRPIFHIEVDSGQPNANIYWWLAMGRPTVHIEVDSGRVDILVTSYGRPTFHIEVDSGRIGADIYWWLAMGALSFILRLIVDG